MSLPTFEYHEARTFDEALSLRAQYDGEARYFSGGTALMLLMRAGLIHPPALIDVRKLPGMHGISFDGGVVRIGAATTHAEIAASPGLRRLLPTVAATFDHVATPRVRNVATVGGNLANANPHQDPPVTLTAFSASAVVRGQAGERRIALEELFVDYLQTSLAPDEILTGIEIPLPGSGAAGAFIKYLPRSCDDYSAVNVAVLLRREGDRVAGARIAVGSMGPTVLCSPEAGALLEGGKPNEARIKEAAAAAVADADPEIDSRGSPEYKRRIAPVIVRRAIEAAWRTSSGTGAP